MDGTIDASNRDWIDPFCPLLSDRIGVQPGNPPQPLNPAARPHGARARAISPTQPGAVAEIAIDGAAPASLDEAVAAAAGCSRMAPAAVRRPRHRRGRRAGLTRLALRCGAIWTTRMARR